MTTYRMMRAATKRGTKERRKSVRLPISVPVFVRGTDGDGKEFLEFATALNVSASGVLLAIRRPISNSTDLLLEIPVAPLPIADSEPPSIRTIRAKLVRITHRDSCHLAAVKFLRVLPT